MELVIVPRDKSGEEQSHDHKGSGNQHIDTLGFVALLKKLVHIHTVHSCPAGLHGPGQGIKSLVFSFAGQHGIRVRFQDQTDIFRLQFIVKLLLLGMVDDIPFRVKNKGIPSVAILF